MNAEGQDDIFAADFTDAAPTPRNYDEYLENISKIASEDLKYLGLGLYGDKKPLGKLTGGLSLLR